MKSKEDLKEKNLDLEEAIFRLFRYIQNESTPETKKITDEALGKIYEDPMYFYKQIESDNQSTQKDTIKTENVPKLSDRLKSRSKNKQGQQ
jgi:hypothetical protein